MADIEITDGALGATGTDGDDLFVFTPNNHVEFLSNVQGGEGFDELVINASPNPVQFFGLYRTYVYTQNLSGIEKITFNSNNNDWLYLSVGDGTLTDGAVIKGGLGTDRLSIEPNSHTGMPSAVPNLTFETWSTGISDITTTDAIYIASYSSEFLTVSARDDLGSVQFLYASTSGPTLLSGSNGQDILYKSSFSDTSPVYMYGGEGDDILIIDGGFFFDADGIHPVDSNYQQCIFDGGLGTNSLYIYGTVSVITSAIDSVDSININPQRLSYYKSDNIYVENEYLSTLLIDTESLGTNPKVNLLGSGQLKINLSGQDFDGSQITFADDAHIRLFIQAGYEGSRITGTHGDDVIIFGTGSDVVTGNGGADLFVFQNNEIEGDEGLGRDTITKFGGDDLLLTTDKLTDRNEDGIIDFGRDKRLDMLASGDSDVGIKNEAGKAITKLAYEGTLTIDGVDYYAYGLPGGQGDAAYQYHLDGAQALV